MGVPVLTTNNGSLMEIIENNKNGYLSESLIDGEVNNFVKKLLNDEEKFKEISNNCFEKSKNYSWLKTTDNLETIYKSLI